MLQALLYMFSHKYDSFSGRIARSATAGSLRLCAIRDEQRAFSKRWYHMVAFKSHFSPWIVNTLGLGLCLTMAFPLQQREDTNTHLYSEWPDSGI